MVKVNITAATRILQLQFESAHSEKRVMGVCAVGSVVFVGRAHLYVIDQYSEAGDFTGTITVPNSISWISGIAASTVHNCLYTAAHQSTQLQRVGLTSATHTVWYVPKNGRRRCQ